MPAEQRRELVVGEAMAAFAAHGYAGTSTEEVARRAGISQPYLFRLFPTKKALFLWPPAGCPTSPWSRTPGMISDANRTAIKAAGLSAAYAALGVGTIREAMITVDELLAYQDAAEQRLLSVRVRPPIQASTATPGRTDHSAMHGTYR